MLQLSRKELLQDKEFREEVEKVQTITIQWKRRYGYSSTDPRFTEATFTDILRDTVEQMAARYVEEFKQYDEETERFLIERELDPNYDEKEAERLASMLNKALGKNDGKR